MLHINMYRHKLLHLQWHLYTLNINSLSLSFIGQLLYRKIRLITLRL